MILVLKGAPKRFAFRKAPRLVIRGWRWYDGVVQLQFG